MINGTSLYLYQFPHNIFKLIFLSISPPIHAFKNWLSPGYLTSLSYQIMECSHLTISGILLIKSCLDSLVYKCYRNKVKSFFVISKKFPCFWFNDLKTISTSTWFGVSKFIAQTIFDICMVNNGQTEGQTRYWDVTVESRPFLLQQWAKNSFIYLTPFSRNFLFLVKPFLFSKNSLLLFNVYQCCVIKLASTLNRIMTLVDNVCTFSTSYVK